MEPISEDVFAGADLGFEAGISCSNSVFVRR